MSITFFELDVRAINSVTCNFFISLFQFSSFSSAVVITHISIERFLVVWFPQRSKLLFSRKTALRSVIVSVTLFALLSIVISIIYSEIKNGFCFVNILGNENRGLLQTTTLITIVLYSSVFNAPALILAIVTPMTIFKLYKKRSSSPLKNHRTTIMLMSVVIAHIFLAGLPALILLGLSVVGINLSNMATAWIPLTLLLNYSINIILYNAFDAKFRERVVSLLSCCSSGIDSDVISSVVNEEEEEDVCHVISVQETSL